MWLITNLTNLFLLGKSCCFDYNAGSGLFPTPDNQEWLKQGNLFPELLNQTFLNYRQIIGEAWGFTQENKRLIVWYAFIPSILSTIFGIFYLIYQFYSFKSSALFENWSHSFLTIVLDDVYTFVRENTDLAVPLSIILVVFALFYFLLPPVAEGAIIQLIARRRNQQQVGIRDGLRYGFLSFLPLFNYSWFARTFNLVVIAGEVGLVLRNLPFTIFETLFPIFIIYAIVSVVFNFLFVFSEYYIVIDDCHVTEAVSKSATLVVKHLNTSLMISILMFIIAIRILLQIIFVLLVPVAMIAFVYFLAASNIPIFGLIIAGVAGLIALIVASYLGAVVHVFSSSVWVFTFLDLTNAPEVSAREKH